MPLRKKKERPEVEIPVTVVDLDKFLGKPRNRIALVGVELEGGWEKTPVGVTIERDGSVLKTQDEGGLVRSGFVGVKFGELPLGPYQPANVGKALKKFWPSHTDKSCGMHVHMSFHSILQYVLLADSPAYQDTVVAYLTKWAKEQGLKEDHPIWPRLNNKSEYCQRKFWPSEQMKADRKAWDHDVYGHRYTMIHYCWARYGTVECRIFPMFDNPVIAHKAVRHLMDITNAYLLAVNKSKVKESGKLNMSTYGSEIKLELRKGEIYEEFYELD